MAFGRLLVLALLAASSALACRGAPLVPGGGPPTGVARPTEGTPALPPRVAPPPRAPGPLVERYGALGRAREESARDVVTEARLDGVTRAIERRRPETWEAPPGGPTAVQRAYAEAARYTPIGRHPGRGTDPGGGVNLDLERLVNFMARLFR